MNSFNGQTDVHFLSNHHWRHTNKPRSHRYDNWLNGQRNSYLEHLITSAVCHIWWAVFIPDEAHLHQILEMTHFTWTQEGSQLGCRALMQQHSVMVYIVFTRLTNWRWAQRLRRASSVLSDDPAQLWACLHFIFRVFKSVCDTIQTGQILISGIEGVNSFPPPSYVLFKVFVTPKIHLLLFIHVNQKHLN